MASKLSDKIKQSAANLRQNQQAAPAGTATQQAFQQAAVGKGTAGPVVSGQSNISETLGVQEQRAVGEQAAQQLDQQAATAQVAEAQQASEDKQYQATQLAQKLESDANYNAQIEKQFNNYEQHSLDMDAAEEELALEDLGFKLALKDKQYMSHLDRMARTANLHDETAYKEEVAKIVMGEELKNFRDNIAFQEKQHGLDLQNMEDLAKIDINSALAAANAAISAELKAQQSGAWSQLGQAVGEGVASYKLSTPKAPTTPPSNVGSTGKLGGPV